MAFNEAGGGVGEGDKLRLSSAAYAGAAVALGSIGFFGITLNLLVVIVIVKDAETLWTPVNVVLLNLVVGDFLVAALGNPFAMVSAVTGGWYWSYEACLWYAWFMSTLGFASIGNLTVMAIERWLLVTRPTKTLSIRHSILLSISVWLYALSMSLPPLFGWGSYGPEAGNVSCSVSWEVHDDETMSGSYIGFIFIFGFFFPVLVISSSYLAIVRTVRKAKKRAGSRRRREARITKMVALMITAFLIAWSPYAALAFATQYFDMKPSPSVAVLPTLLAKSSVCYNPVIYAGLNPQFFQSLKKICGISDGVATVPKGQNMACTPINRQKVKTEE